MVFDKLLKTLYSHLLHRRVLSIGTNYYATNDLEKEYVSLINLTKTMLIEIQPAVINSKSIFENLERELDQRDIPLNRKFIEIKPADNTVNEYALLSNIIMGSDRYLYIEIFKMSPLIDIFTQMVEEAGGEIVEKSRTDFRSIITATTTATTIVVCFLWLICCCRGCVVCFVYCGVVCFIYGCVVCCIIISCEHVNCGYVKVYYCSSCWSTDHSCNCHDYYEHHLWV